MARLSEVKTMVRHVGWRTYLWRVWQQTGEDDLLMMAAALAYSWLFAVFPFFIFLLSLTAYLPAETKDAVHHAVYTSMPSEAADVIWRNVEDVLKRPRNGLLSLGLALTIFSASGGMAMTITGINRCYEIKSERSVVVQRLFAMLMTIIIASMVLLVLVLLPVGTLVLHYIQRHGGFSDGKLLYVLTWVRYPIALLLLFLILSTLYYLAPAIKQRFVFITPGAVFCVVVWLLLAFGFRLYVAKFGSFSQTYGAVGGVVILLLLFYIDAVVLLIGAEINSEIDFELLGIPRGSRDFRSRQDHLTE